MGERDDAFYKCRSVIKSNQDIAPLRSMFVNNEVDINQQDDERGDTLLHTAVWARHYEAVDLLLSCGASVNAKNLLDHRTPLFEAIEALDKKLVVQLLEAGADVNAKDKIQYTPLVLAAYSGIVDLVSCILAAGAEVDAKDKDGQTVLFITMFECLGNLPTIVSILIQAGADVNTRDNWNSTPLHALCHTKAPVEQATQTASILLASGADVNAKNIQGRTVLHFIQPGYLELLSIFLAAGAQIEAVDKMNMTPCRVAYQNENSELEEALIVAGAVAEWKTEKPEPYLIDARLPPNLKLTPFPMPFPVIPAPLDESYIEYYKQKDM